MAQIGELVAGSTEPLIFTLLADGVPFNLDGYTVEIKLRTGAFVRVETDPAQTEVVANQAVNTGKVQFTPEAEDFTHSDNMLPPEPEKFPCRFKVTDGQGTIEYFPRAGWDYIAVYRE